MTPLLLVAALATSPSQAYELMGLAWPRGPSGVASIEWYMADAVEDSLDNLAEWPVDTDGDDVPDTTFDDPYDYQVWVIEKSYDNWSDPAPCAEIKATYMSPAAAGFEIENTGSDDDGYNVIYWDDPRGVWPAGVLGVTSSYTNGTFLGWVAGKKVYEFSNADVDFNDDIDWATTEEIEAGCSGGMQALEPVATHELGHFWGLDHTCEEGDACADPEDQQATMYWSTTNCSLDQATINANDIEGINALYGPSAQGGIVSGEDLVDTAIGAIPLTLDFGITSDYIDQFTSIDWDFGDGEHATEMTAAHTYTEPGQYTVALEILGYSETCGSWSSTDTSFGAVTACAVPSPALSPEGVPYEGLFTYTQVEDLSYQMLNRADTSVYGCIDTVVWQVWSESGELVQETKSWAPVITFPEAGSWRVVLNVGGPAGVVAAELTIDAGTAGCATVPHRFATLGILAAAGLALLRRKRRNG